MTFFSNVYMVPSHPSLLPVNGDYMGASGKLLTKNGKITEGGKLKMWTCTPPLPIPQGPGPGPGPQGPPGHLAVQGAHKTYDSSYRFDNRSYKS